MSMSASTALSAVSKWKSTLPLLSWHGGATCIGVICLAGEDVSGGKDKECGVPTCMGDVESCGTLTHIGIVLQHWQSPAEARGLVDCCEGVLHGARDTTRAGADLQLSGLPVT